MADHHLRVIRLPKELPPLLIRKFAVLNVEAIRSIYERPFLTAPQLVRTADSWAVDLRNPLSVYWVLIAPNIETGQASLEEGQWIGMYLFRGPLALRDYLFSAAPKFLNGFSADDTYWRADMLYVKEAHRSMSAVSLLYETSVSFLERESGRLLKSDRAEKGSRKPVRAHISAIVDRNGVLHEENSTTQSRLVMDLTLAQSLDYSGLREGVPEEFFEEDDFSKPADSLYESVLEFSV